MMKSMLARTIAVGTLLAIANGSLATAADWTQFRGNHRDGKSDEKGLANQWPTEGPKLLWQANQLGSGYSSPSVAGGLAYLITNQGLETEEAIAISMADGKVQWKTKLGKVGANRGPQYPGSRSTPTIDGDRIYALGSDGDLACLDAKRGTVLWTKNLQRDLGGKPGSWAYTESPLIDGDRLICSPGGPDATVVALQKGTGELIWKCATEEGDEASYSSPIQAEIDGVPQYVLFLSKGVAGIDAKTGKFLWRYKKTADQAANVQTPVVSGNFVYTGASRVGGSVAAITNGATEAKEVYFSKTLPTGMGGAVLVGDYLYGTSGPTILCVKYSTGEIQWQERSIGASSICYADGKLYLHGENNDIAVVEANPTAYKLLGKATPPNAPERGQSKAWTYPAISDGKMLVFDAGSLWCYDIR